MRDQETPRLLTSLIPNRIQAIFFTSERCSSRDALRPRVSYHRRCCVKAPSLSFKFWGECSQEGWALGLPRYWLWGELSV